MSRLTFEFFYINDVTMEYLGDLLNSKRDYYDEDIEIIKMEKFDTTCGGIQTYNILCKGKY